jgi:hypothetical protein
MTSVVVEAGASVDEPSSPSASASPSFARLATIAVLGLWLATPFLILDNFAQDAVPFLVAGTVVREDPTQVYGDSLAEMPPAFVEESCAISPAGTDCANGNVAFVSPPPALPLAVGLSILGPTFGPLLLRLLASLGLVGGVLALRRRLLERDPDAEGVLAVVLALLTPMFLLPVILAQNSPLQFAAAALGIAVAGRSRPIGVALGILWGVTIAFKLTPIVLVVVLVARRQWTVLAAGLGTVAALTVAALPLGGVAMWQRFVEASAHLQGTSGAIPSNGSIDGFVGAMMPGLTGTTSAGLLVWAARLVALAGLVMVARRIRDDDTLWSFAWLGTLLLVPLVWWHYLWLAVAAVVIALAAARRTTRLADPRLLIPFAVASVPISVLNGSGGAAPWAQFPFLVVALVWSGALAMKAEAPAAT